jgi:hypothetical protein
MAAGGAVVWAASNSMESSIVAPAIVAAVVAAAVSLTTFGLAGRRARLDRQRQLFADAFEVVAEYREYPFIVRRRRKDAAAEERTRISSELSEVQAKLNSYRARLRVEASRVGAQYAALVEATRRVAGAMIRDGWNADPIDADAQMHAPALDFRGLDACEERFLEAVSDHLGWGYAPLRRLLRTALRRVQLGRQRLVPAKGCHE